MKIEKIRELSGKLSESTLNQVIAEHSAQQQLENEHRFDYGEPEEANYKKPKSDDRKISEALDGAISHLRGGAEKCIKYVENLYQTIYQTDKTDIYWKWMENKEYDRIFDPQNDSNWYVMYAMKLIAVLQQDSDELDKSHARYVNGKQVFTPPTIKERLLELFDSLDDNNPKYKKFKTILSKVATYFDKLREEDKADEEPPETEDPNHLDESYNEFLPVLTAKQKASLIDKYTTYWLLPRDLTDVLNSELTIGSILLSKKHYKHYYPEQDELKTLAPFVLGDVRSAEELVPFITSFLITACEPANFTSLTKEQCVKKVLDLNITSLDRHNLAILVRRIYDYFTEQETNKLTDLKQRLLDCDDIPGFIFENPNMYEKELIHIARWIDIKGDSFSKLKMTATSDWKRQFIDYYKLNQVTRNKFFDCYNELIKRALVRELEFNALDVDEENHLSVEKVIAEWDKRTASERKSRAGSIGKGDSKRNHTAPIMLQNIHTKKFYTFDDMVQCAKRLKVSKEMLKRFKRGEKTKINRTWKIINIKDIP